MTLWSLVYKFLQYSAAERLGKLDQQVWFAMSSWPVFLQVHVQFDRLLGPQNLDSVDQETLAMINQHLQSFTKVQLLLVNITGRALRNS